MKKYPFIKDNNVSYVLTKDFQDFGGWILLVITSREVYTKADRRIKGDQKNAEIKFQDLYGTKTSIFSYSTLKDILNE